MQHNQKTQRQGEIITEDMPGLLRLTHVVYALQAISFVFGITYFIAVIAVIINYLKYPSVSGTWLQSHFHWQIRTFWFGLLWYVVGFLTTIIVIGWLILFANYIWLIYRVVKGWIYLNDKRTVL